MNKHHNRCIDCGRVFTYYGAHTLHCGCTPRYNKHGPRPDGTRSEWYDADNTYMRTQPNKDIEERMDELRFFRGEN